MSTATARPLRKHRKQHLANKADPTAKRVAIGYVRISVDRINETSTESQRIAIEAWCKANNVELLRIEVEEGRSAYANKVARPKFDACMRDLRNGAANTFVVWKVDRMIRYTAEFHAVRAKIRDCGASLVSTSEGVDTHDAKNFVNEIILSIYATLAEMESANKSDRIVDWNERRFDAKLPPCGPRPYGYNREDGKANALVINEDEAHVLQRVASDIIDNNGSVRGWCVKLTKEGKLTSTGKAWQPVVLKRILISPTTAGCIALEDGSLLRGDEAAWPAIFNMETHAALVRILADPSRKRHWHGNHARYLMTGIARCSECDRTLNTRPVKNQPRYECLGCGMSIDGATLEGAARHFIVNNVDREAWQALKLQGRSTAPEVIAEHEAELLNIARMQAAGSITLAQFEVMNAGALERLANAKHGEALDLPDVDDLAEAWDSMKVPAQRMALMAVTKRIEIRPFGKGARGIARIHII